MKHCESSFRYIALGSMTAALILAGCDGSNSLGDADNPSQNSSANLILETRQIANADLGILVNADFQEPLGSLPGWTACVDDNALRSVGRSANRRVRVGAQECIVQAVAIAPGSENSISCQLSADNPNQWSGMAISFYDADGEFLSETEAVRAESSTLTRLMSAGTAPANTDVGVVWFYTESGGRIDSCELESTSDNEPTDTQTYRKTLEVRTSGNFGGYGGFGFPGFGFNGINSQQFYSQRFSTSALPNIGTGDDFLIDGFEPQVLGTFNQRNWEVQWGLASGYLHVVTTIYKSNTSINTTPLEQLAPQIIDSPNQIWNDDSFEIFINAGNESTVGYDDNDFSRVIRFNSNNTPVATFTGGNSRLNLTDEVRCNLEEYGARSCEVRYSLEELGIAGLAVAEIGFDIQMNFDDDGGERDAKYSWCSGNTVSAWRDMSVVDCSLRIINDCEVSCEGF